MYHNIDQIKDKYFAVKLFLNEKYNAYSEYLVNLFNSKIINDDVNFDDPNILFLVALKYISQGHHPITVDEINLVKTYCFLAIRAGNTDAYNILTLLYRFEYPINKKKYAEQGCYYQSAYCASVLGGIYCDEQKYDDAIKAYSLAIQYGDQNSLIALGNLYYHKLDNKNDALEFYLQALQLNKQTANDQIIEYYGTNPILVYTRILMIQNPSELVQKMFNNLLQNDSVIMFKQLSDKQSNCFDTDNKRKKFSFGYTQDESMVT